MKKMFSFSLFPSSSKKNSESPDLLRITKDEKDEKKTELVKSTPTLIELIPEKTLELQLDPSPIEEFLESDSESESPMPAPEPFAHILSFLDLKSLATCELVSKSWQKTILDKSTHGSIIWEPLFKDHKLTNRNNFFNKHCFKEEFFFKKNLSIVKKHLVTKGVIVGSNDLLNTLLKDSLSICSIKNTGKTFLIEHHTISFKLSLLKVETCKDIIKSLQNPLFFIITAKNAAELKELIEFIKPISLSMIKPFIGCVVTAETSSEILELIEQSKICRIEVNSTPEKLQPSEKIKIYQDNIESLLTCYLNGLFKEIPRIQELQKMKEDMTEEHESTNNPFSFGFNSGSGC